MSDTCSRHWFVLALILVLGWLLYRLAPVITPFAVAAAIAYLTDLHGMFGDWPKALAAYNCGEGRVLRVIRDQNINYLDNFWDLYERLPRETAVA